MKFGSRAYPFIKPDPIGACCRIEYTVPGIPQAPCDYELRTTCVPGLVEEADIRAMGEAVRGAKRWMLQQFAPSHALDPELHGVEPHAPGRLGEFAEMARGYVGAVGIRGI